MTISDTVRAEPVEAPRNALRQAQGKRARLNQSGLLFVPRRWQRAAAVRWLKRVHAWTGFWGALLFLMMGTSGFLLNHRATARIDTGEPVEVSATTIAVAPGAIRDADALGAWAKRELGLASEPREPRGEGGGDRRGGRKERFLGKDRAAPETWTRQFNHPDGRVTVAYVPGSATVSVRQDAVNLAGFIKNLHKGGGLGIVWVLFLDTIAGALVAMSLTGLLLWTRFHGSRLVAGGIVLASVSLAVAGVFPFML